MKKFESFEELLDAINEFNMNTPENRERLGVVNRRLTEIDARDIFIEEIAILKKLEEITGHLLGTSVEEKRAKGLLNLTISSRIEQLEKIINRL